MNIAVGKFGKSILFNQEKWSLKGGDHDMPGLIAVLASKNPEINFWIISRNDVARLPKGVWEKINVNNNIFDLWENFKDSKDPAATYYPTQKLKELGVKINLGIFWGGPAGTTSLKEKTYKVREPSKFAKPSLMTERYVGPLVHFLNEWKGPYVELTDDTRYFPIRAADLFNKAKYTGGSVDLKNAVSMKRYKKYFDTERETVYFDMRNVNLPTFVLASEPDVRLKEPGKRENLISVYSNGFVTSGGKNKFHIVKEYLLNIFKDITIYGVWPEEDNPEVVNYPDNFHAVPMSKLNSQMYNTKYTLMIALKYDKVFCSSKLYKHLIHGIIPFFHPQYQTDVYEPFPSFLKLKSAKDFKDKIEWLEADHNRYLDLWHQCQKILRNEWFAGEQVQSFFESAVHEFVDPNYKFSPKDNIVKMTCLWPEKYLTRNISNNIIEHFLV